MLPSREDRRTQHDLRLKLAGRGYQELVNFSFVEEKWEKDFGGEAAPIRLLNPIASQLSVMRTQLIGGLVDILRYNLNRKEDRVRVFELGRVFFQDPTIEPSDTSVKGVRQPEHLAGLAYGTADAPQWGIKSRRVDFFDVKGDLERLAFPLTLDFVPEVFPSLHPGRSAGVYLDGKQDGLIGELHPRLQQAYDLPLCPVVFEIDVEPLLSVPVTEHKPVFQVPEVAARYFARSAGLCDFEADLRRGARCPENGCEACLSHRLPSLRRVPSGKSACRR